MPRLRPLVALLPVLVAASLLAACADEDDGGGAASSAARSDTPRPTTEPSTTPAREDAPGAGLEVVPDVVAALQPSIVAILTDAGEGSGVVYTASGVVVTNDHVVDGAETIQVAFADGDRVQAEVVATDPRSDLAVLQAERDDLPAASFAEELPVVGELAIAMGNPLGFENSVTAGIISGLGRAIPGSAQLSPALVDLIQTDAAISPGNSGGALVDGDGRVVGINVAYIPPNTAGAVSIGFAIPSPTVLDVVTQLLDDGEVRYPFLGITPLPLTPEIAERLDLGTEEGVIVQSVVDGGPADDGGLQPGDLLVSLGEQPVRGVEEFLAELRDYVPGDEVTVEVLRDGDREQFQVRLDERPD